MKAETKLFVGIILGTLAIVIGAILFFNSQSATGTKVDSSLLVRPDSEKIASDSASVTLVEFSDYQCPACGAYHPLLKQLVSEFRTSLTFVYRDFPLQQHKNAYLAAQAAQAAGRQRKYWEMHDILFEKQRDWAENGKAKDLFIEYAQTLAIDVEQFKKDMDSPEIKNKINRDLQDGITLGINATPTFFLNSEKLQSPGSLDDFRTLIKAAILKVTATQKLSEEYHVHANFSVYLNGQVLDFSVAKYQSTETKDLNPDIHLHDGKGDLIHVHKKGKTLGEFFKSLGITFTKDCFIDDSGNKYCNDNTATLKVFVNGLSNNQFDAYVPQDLDRILISYGNDDDQMIKQQVSGVADDACIYSKKCPERGTPPTENCVGGLGTGCE